MDHVIRARRTRLFYVALVITVLALGVVAVQLRPPAAHADNVWTLQGSGTSSNLFGVSCPAVAVCYAVGAGGTIRTTTNSGGTWTGQTSNTSSILYAVSCPAVSVCYAVGDAGTIRATRGNPALGWGSQSSGVGSYLLGIDCPSVTVCYAVGQGGTIVTTVTGGSSWSSTTVGFQDLWGVSCPSVTVCYAVGISDAIYFTADGGNTWTSRSSGTWASLYGISCPTIDICVATSDNETLSTFTAGLGWTESNGVTVSLDGVDCTTPTKCYVTGGGGKIYQSTNWNHLTEQPSGTANWLWSVSCPVEERCWAVGDAGTIAMSSTVVPTVSPPTLTPPPVTPPPVTPSPLPTLPPIISDRWPSDDCDAGTNVVTGFLDGVYAKAKTAPAGANATALCVAAETAGEHAGGKVVLDTSAPGLSVASIDLDSASVAACGANANNVQVGGGLIAGEPWWVNVTPSPANSTDSAWVCVRLTNAVGFRVRFAPGTSVGLPAFIVDKPSVHVPAYAEDPPAAPTQPSAACQLAPASKTRLANLTVGTTPVQLYGWEESPTKAHVCVREGTAGTGKGAQLTVTTDGVNPGITTTNSLAPCPFPIFTSSSPSFGIYSSNPSTSPPVSACVAVGATALGATVNAPTVGSVVTLQQDTL